MLNRLPKNESVTFAFSLLIAAALVSSDLVGQESTPEGAPTLQAQSGAPVESIWEFGLEVKASANARGIAASVPVPREWPEQEIEILEEVTTDGIGRLKVTSKTKWTKQMDFRISRMRGGQTETAYIRYRIKKKMIKAPQDTSVFEIAKKPPSNLNTFLRPSPYIESKDKRIIAIAESLWDESLTGWAQVEKNFRWVRENIEYKFDRTIRSCLEALDNKQGDCEELSSMFIAICRAQGIPARAVWVTGTSGTGQIDHTYPEFYLVDDQGEGHWFPCQAAGTYEFGAMTEARPILQKGDRFRNAQSRKDERYLKPILTAKDAAGPLSIQPIKRPVINKQQQ